MSDFAITLGRCCTGRNYKFTYQRACSGLAPDTSHLEGVGNYLAACAAITLVHYTPPPFIALIVPCNSNSVKIFLQFICQFATELHSTLASQGISYTFYVCKIL